MAARRKADQSLIARFVDEMPAMIAAFIDIAVAVPANQAVTVGGDPREEKLCKTGRWTAQGAAAKRAQ